MRLRHTLWSGRLAVVEVGSKSTRRGSICKLIWANVTPPTLSTGVRGWVFGALKVERSKRPISWRPLNPKQQGEKAKVRSRVPRFLVWRCSDCVCRALQRGFGFLATTTTTTSHHPAGKQMIDKRDAGCPSWCLCCRRAQTSGVGFGLEASALARWD